MTIHKSLIAGEWVGSDAIKKINPSNANDSCGKRRPHVLNYPGP